MSDGFGMFWSVYAFCIAVMISFLIILAVYVATHDKVTVCVNTFDAAGNIAMTECHREWRPE